MGHHFLAGNPPVPLVLRRSARARRITLRVSRLDGRVTLTLPRFTPEAEALAFAREKEGWVRSALAAQPGGVVPGPGVALPVEGRMRRIEQGTGRRIVLAEDAIAVPGPPGQMPARLRAWLKTRARDRLAAACDGYAGRLGRPYARITLRDPRSRWGSCSSAGALMFSWRLVMAPGDVLDYVAAHEVAHLRHMDHSAAFWATTEDLFGPLAGPRAWLRDNGASLHQYRFGD